MTAGEGMPRFESGSGMTAEPETSAPELFAAMVWQDWPEASLKDVAVYLRGGTSLDLTAEWRAVFPTHW